MSKRAVLSYGRDVRERFRGRKGVNSRKKTNITDRILQMLIVLGLIMIVAFSSMAAQSESASSAEETGQETIAGTSQQVQLYELTMVGDEEVPLAMPRLWEQDPGPAHMITWGLFWLTAILMGVDMRRHHRRIRELKTLLKTERKKLR